MSALPSRHLTGPHPFRRIRPHHGLGLVLLSGLLFSAIRAAPLTWDANGTGAGQTDGGGTWLSADQWWDGAANATWNNGTPDDAVIGNGGAGGSITLGAVSAGTVTFGAFSGTYTLTGGSLDQSGGIMIGAASAGVTFSSVISGAGGLTKDGPGTLTLSNTGNSFGGQLTIARGTLTAPTGTGVNNKSANGILGNSALPVILGSASQTGRLAIQVDGSVTSNKDFTLAAGGTGEFQFGNVGTFQITNADRSLTLSGAIGGSGNLVKLGGAAIVLSGNNNYGGSTTVREGPLRLGSANAIPGGIAETGGASPLTINGNGTLNLGAAIGLTAASGNFLRGLGTGAGQFQIPGGVSGFEAFGSARQVIVNNDPSFELQWGIPTFNPSALLLGYHPQTATGALTVQNRIDLNGATRTIAVNGGIATLAGNIRTSSGTAGLVKTGAGALALTGTNTYNGATTILGGTLTMGTGSTLASTSAIQLAAGARLDINVANQSLEKLAASGGLPAGAILRYSQPQTAAGPANGPGTILGTVELNASNVNPDYTLDFGAGSSLQNVVTATYNSPVTLSGNTSLNSSTAVFTGGTGMTIGASTAGTKTLTLTGTNTGANTLGGVIGNGSGALAVTKSNSGAWTLTGANAYTGPTTVNGGTLTLAGVDGAIAGSPVRVAGGTLVIANTGAANHGDRLGDALTFTMSGGAFNFNNTAGAGNNFSEATGTLALAGGFNTVAIQQAAAGQTSTLTFAGLSRTTGVVQFSGTGLGSTPDPRGTITFASAPALVDGILGPWATVNGTTYASLSGNDLVAYSGPLVDVTRQSSGSKVIPDSPTNHVRIVEGTGGSPAGLTLAASTTGIRSLLHSISGGTGAATVVIGSGETLRVDAIHAVSTAGALTVGSPANTGTLTAATPGGELLLITSSANTFTVNSAIADHSSASSVTKDGSGTVVLDGNNTFTGGVVLNSGTLVPGGTAKDAALGHSAGTVTLNGGTLSLLSYGSGNNSTRTGPIMVSPGASATIQSSFQGPPQVAMPVTGSGTLTFASTGGSGSGTTYTSTASTFTGAIRLDNPANVSVQMNSLGDSSQLIQLGLSAGATATFTYAGSANLTQRGIALGGAATGANFNFNSSGAGTVTLSQPLAVFTPGNKTLTLGGGNTGINALDGPVADGAVAVISITKAGAGLWYLGGTNSYTGATTINDGGGTLGFRKADHSLSPATTLTIGGSAGLRLLEDGTGTILLGNAVNLNVAGSGERDGPTIFVGNNGPANGGNGSGSGAGATIALGVFDLVAGGSDARSTQRITVEGANGYRLQMGGLIIGKRADFGAPQIIPNSAPVTISGAVTQASGKLATDSTNGDQLQLLGTAAGNLISGVIRDAADYPANPNAKPFNLLKGGTGSWTLSGDNSHTGATALNAGKLFIDGNQAAATGALTVASNATLGGRGTLGGNVTVSSGGRLEFNLSTPAAGHDSLDVVAGKTFTLAGASTLTITGTGGARPGVYTLVNAPGGLSGAAPATLNLPPDWVASVSIDANKLVLTVTSTGAAGGYGDWQAANGTTQAVNGDHDGDGVTNGIEWFVHGPNASSGADSSPAVFSSSGGLTVIWTKDAGFGGAYGIDYVVESADVPQGPWTPEVLGERVTIVGQEVRFTFATPLPARKYAQLKITGP